MITVRKRKKQEKPKFLEDNDVPQDAEDKLINIIKSDDIEQAYEMFVECKIKPNQWLGKTISTEKYFWSGIHFCAFFNAKKILNLLLKMVY